MKNEAAKFGRANTRVTCRCCGAGAHSSYAGRGSDLCKKCMLGHEAILGHSDGCGGASSDEAVLACGVCTWAHRAAKAHQRQHASRHADQ